MFNIAKQTASPVSFDETKTIKEVIMKEIRLHGRGGQGVVKSSHLIVEAVVKDGGFAQFIPFFGVERKGSPVFGYLRLDKEPIRMNTQIYEPGLVMVFDDTLLDHAQTFAGLKDGGILVINTNKDISEMYLPENTGTIAKLDATAIAQECIGRSIPNTTMLGAFAKATGLVNEEILFETINKAFGKKNEEAARLGFERVEIISGKGA